MGGDARENLPVLLLGLLQPATLVQVDGGRKQVCDLGGAEIVARSRLLRHLVPYARYVIAVRASHDRPCE
jgi:hypothetical protein